ncbi:MAG: MFS transporter [Victivallales bacterium]|nr:MFS transporter [Victivallales bacterium]
MLYNRTSLSLATAWCINQLAYSIVYPFIPGYLNTARGIPMETVGLIFPAMGAAAIVGPPVAGWLTDRLGRRFVLQFGQTIRTAVFLGLAALAFFEAPFWAFLVALVFNTFFGSFFGIAADAYLADMTTEAERPMFYSNIRIGYNIGWALGPATGSFLAHIPFWALFLCTAALCQACAFYTSYICKAPAKGAGRASKGLEWRSLAKLFTGVELTTLLLGAFILYLLVSQLYSTMSIYATGIMGIGRHPLGLVYSLNGLLIILLQVPATLLMDKIQARQYHRLVLGCAMYAVGYFAIGLAGGAWSLAGCVAILTGGELLVQPALYTILTRCSPQGRTGITMASSGLVRGIGYAVGPWFGAQACARWSDRPVLLWGSQASFAVLAGLIFLSATLLAQRRLKTSAKVLH